MQRGRHVAVVHRLCVVVLPNDGSLELERIVAGLPFVRDRIRKHPKEIEPVAPVVLMLHREPANLHANQLRILGDENNVQAVMPVRVQVGNMRRNLLTCPTRTKIVLRLVNNDEGTERNCRPIHREIGVSIADTFKPVNLLMRDSRDLVRLTAHMSHHVNRQRAMRQGKSDNIRVHHLSRQHALFSGPMILERKQLSNSAMRLPRPGQPGLDPDPAHYAFPVKTSLTDCEASQNVVLATKAPAINPRQSGTPAMDASCSAASGIVVQEL